MTASYASQFICAMRVTLNRAWYTLIHPLIRTTVIHCAQKLPSIAGLYGAAFDQGIEWLVVKGIADFADDSAAVTWQRFASVMAASVVFNFLSDTNVFSGWTHYGGDDIKYVFPHKEF